MHETYSLHKDGGFANELNPAKSALKISQCLLRLLHTSDVSAIASARTFTLEHKRRKQDGLYLALTIALTFCRFTLEDF